MTTLTLEKAIAAAAIISGAGLPLKLPSRCLRILVTLSRRKAAMFGRKKESGSNSPFFTRMTLSMMQLLTRSHPIGQRSELRQILNALLTSRSLVIVWRIVTMMLPWWI